MTKKKQKTKIKGSRGRTIHKIFIVVPEQRTYGIEEKGESSIRNTKYRKSSGVKLKVKEVGIRSVKGGRRKDERQNRRRIV